MQSELIVIQIPNGSQVCGCLKYAFTEQEMLEKGMHEQVNVTPCFEANDGKIMMNILCRILEKVDEK